MAVTVSDILHNADLFRAAYPDWPSASVPVCIVEPSGRNRPLDDILPARTRRPPVPGTCQSCGHIPADCNDMCC